MSGSVRSTKTDSSLFFGSIWYKDRPVPTWTDIKDHARSSYKLAEEHDHSFKVVFEYPGRRSAGGDRVALSGDGPVMGRPFVSLLSRRPDGRARRAATKLQPWQSARCALDGDVYVVRHTVMVDQLQARRHRVVDARGGARRRSDRTVASHIRTSVRRDI